MTSTLVHIVYIPGTVKALSTFIPSLLANTDWDFRLVSNACQPWERELLQTFAKDPRVTSEELPTGEVIPLGRALTHLLSHPPAYERVGFMDSDILFSGPVGQEVDRLFEESDAVFSGRPIWALEEDTVLRSHHSEVAGPYCTTEDGLLLGSSYFAIYRRSALETVMASSGVTPDKYSHPQDITDGFRDFLSARGLSGLTFETPKLLNVALLWCGFKSCYLESEEIHHIGGFSMNVYGSTPGANAADILDYQDFRPHMERKLYTCGRLLAEWTGTDFQTSPPADMSAHAMRELELVSEHWLNIREGRI